MSHFLVEQGKEDLLQRSLPQVKTLCLQHFWKHDGQVRGKEPQGDGEAGGRRQGVGLGQGR